MINVKNKWSYREMYSGRFSVCSEKHIQTEEIDGTDIFQKSLVFSFHLQFLNTDL